MGEVSRLDSYMSRVKIKARQVSFASSTIATLRMQSKNQTILILTQGWRGWGSHCFWLTQGALKAQALPSPKEEHMTSISEKASLTVKGYNPPVRLLHIPFTQNHFFN
jgi:hypothetical protein